MDKVLCYYCGKEVIEVQAIYVVACDEYYCNQDCLRGQRYKEHKDAEKKES